MKLHGKTLAGSHKLGPRSIRDRLLTRLAENEDVLMGACNLLTAAVKANRRIAPAGEWLLDNFYLIEEQIRTARRHLPKGYSRELPRLLSGPSAGLPRGDDIALETISHGDGRVDPETLGSFVAAYQTVTFLTLGELWAIPIMLRLALIENLRRAGALPLPWIEQRLSESGLTIEQLIRSESQQQAADQVSISNSIGSLRFLGAMGWRGVGGGVR